MGKIPKNGLSVKGDGNEVSARACPAPGLRGSPTYTNCLAMERLGSGLKAPRGDAWRLYPDARSQYSSRTGRIQGGLGQIGTIVLVLTLYILCSNVWM